MFPAILVTGGAGYIGSVLVPKLLERYRVVVLDTLWFGGASLGRYAGHERFRLLEMDLRDGEKVARLLGAEPFAAVVHLAAVSNDPSSEIDPELTRAINLEATARLMRSAKESGVPRFVFASSASVYGIKKEPEVTEDLSLEPITLYARYKAEGEEILAGLTSTSFCGVSVRAATVCGYSPRLRLDLTINILTYHALVRKEIRVFGGGQMRPNIQIRDLADFYCELLAADSSSVRGKAFNVSYSNATVRELAELVRAEVDPELPITVVPSDDQRSYHLSAELARRELGFTPRHDLRSAVRELREAFADGRITDPEDPVYRNVEHMKRNPSIYRPLSTGITG